MERGGGGGKTHGAQLFSCIDLGLTMDGLGGDVQAGIDDFIKFIEGDTQMVRGWSQRVVPREDLDCTRCWGGSGGTGSVK